MWQRYLTYSTSSQTFPPYQAPLRRVYTPTPDGFERFLRECVGLPCGEAGRPMGVVR
jgi:hypothetical protein